MYFKHIYIACLFALVICCKETTYTWKSMEVTATAYNSLAYQTSRNPNITAFGDSLVPGKKYIAVSRDLLKIGLDHNTLVRIEGIEGLYIVKDKMNKRWNKRIDIYMDEDVKRARAWGKKKVRIWYRVPEKEPDAP